MNKNRLTKRKHTLNPPAQQPRTLCRKIFHNLLKMDVCFTSFTSLFCCYSSILHYISYKYTQYLFASFCSGSTKYNDRHVQLIFLSPINPRRSRHCQLLKEKLQTCHQGYRRLLPCGPVIWKMTPTLCVGALDMAQHEYTPDCFLYQNKKMQ